MIPTRIFGDTSLHVPILGFGAGHIGSSDLTEDHVGHLLNDAVDRGITLFDTARGYDLSEERLGRHLSWRRGEVLLSTKVGYGVEGVEDWTPECIRRGIDDALGRLQTDYIDIVHLHSRPKHVLEHHGVVEALIAARDHGKLRAAAYSGEGDALDWALADGRFDVVQCSINLCDLANHRDSLSAYPNVGVIAKRPLANAPWRFTERPHGHYAEVYWERLSQMNISREGSSWHELALRFVTFHTRAHTSIVGTSSLEHLHSNADIVALGPLSDALAEHIHDAFSSADDGWLGQI